MNRIIWIYAFLLTLFCSCGKRATTDKAASEGQEVELSYAQNLRMTEYDGYTRVELRDPWKKGKTLQVYYLIYKEGVSPAPNGTVVRVPLSRMVVFTTAHANLMEWLGAGSRIAGVADARYMLIPDVRKRIGKPRTAGGIVDCGDAMAPSVERIVDLGTEAILLSPFENGGGYGTLEKTAIPIIACADYMETSALGRAEWMRFYGRLVGRGNEADSLFRVVEREYKRLAALAAKDKERKSVLPERKTGSVWYLPGGESSMGRLYKDAHIGYAYASDTHSGSLALPFETVLDKAGEADVWLMSYNGQMNRRLLLSEFEGYGQLKAYRNGSVFGCAVDRKPYFEEVSWRPDWLLRDLIIIFHPSLRGSVGKNLKYYEAIN